MKPALVILAAGASERLGEPKALVDLGGRTALERLLEAGAILDGAVPLVVAGAHAEAIRARAPAGCEVLVNPDWRLGRTGGIALAASRRAGADLCLAPIDVPLVPRAVFVALDLAWERAGFPELGWLAPAFRGRHGHPVVIGRALALRLAEMENDSSLRALRALATPLLSVEVASERTLDDLDTPEDLRRLRTGIRPGSEQVDVEPGADRGR